MDTGVYLAHNYLNRSNYRLKIFSYLRDARYPILTHELFYICIIPFEIVRSYRLFLECDKTLRVHVIPSNFQSIILSINRASIPRLILTARSSNWYVLRATISIFFQISMNFLLPRGKHKRYERCESVLICAIRVVRGVARYDLAMER